MDSTDKDIAPVESSDAAVARLALLSPLEYDRVRETAASKMGVRVSVLDAEVRNARPDSGDKRDAKQLIFAEVEPWPEPVNGAALLDEIIKTIGTFIICDESVKIAAALWITFTWLIDAVQVAPLAVITAPEKRCGKSQLLNLFHRLSRRPLVASNISPAALFRVMEACGPTLLIDEADSFFKENEELRGIVNSGHTRQSAYVIRTVGDDHEPKQFSTWGAKAIAGIGTLPDTVLDRAIILELRRKLPTESAQRLRHAPPQLFGRLASMLARFSLDASSAIAAARPALPDSLNDRAQDNWEPLFAIADHAGGEWPESARRAAIKLSGIASEESSPAAELLADIREAFDNSHTQKLFTADLLQALTDDDLKPWATYNRGKPMSPAQLARKLREYKIEPRTIRCGTTTKKGFERKWFEDAFNRYLPDTSAAGVTPSQTIETPCATTACSVTPAVTPNRCDGTERGSVTTKSLNTLTCSGVTANTEDAEVLCIESPVPLDADNGVDL